MKTLVIIGGVTGAIGSACLARFSRGKDVTIIGLSRKAKHFSNFCTDGKLTDNTIICSVGNVTATPDCVAFARAINISAHDRVIYIHAVGFYAFELNENGAVEVQHDDDGDGIDDRVMQLSHDAFFAMSDALAALGKPVTALIFGGIADKHRLAVHQSWWKTMAQVRTSMSHRKFSSQVPQNVSYRILSISSVICPNEIITRPFVFQDTDADPRFWLMPHEVAEKVAKMTGDQKERMVEAELFHKAGYYVSDYFTEPKFTERKIAELGIGNG